MKIGVLIITRGDRPKFLEHAKYLISEQTLQPDIVEIVDDKPLSDKIDITYRYRIGCERLFKKGVDVIIFWEDDDWYSKDYIQLMCSHWIANGQPDVFGLNTTVYYNININKYVLLSHPGRASMMSTMISKEAKINWGKDDYAFTDMVLWQQLKGISIKINETIAIGIKHGTGLCGGGGHVNDWKGYNLDDLKKDFLRMHTDEKSFCFYTSRKHVIEVKQYDKNPFLSIITRKYKRPAGFNKNQESIKCIYNKSIEQIFITDPVGYGMEEANKSFEYVKDKIAGDYVYLLDDDDFIVNTSMVQELQAIAKKRDSPDIIFFRMIIKNGQNGDYYPTEKCWKAKEPIIAQIGGSCFVVRKDVFKKFIHTFGLPRCGDFNFLKSIYDQGGVRAHWYDCLMAETGKVSRGASE